MACSDHDDISFSPGYEFMCDTTKTQGEGTKRRYMSGYPQQQQRTQLKNSYVHLYFLNPIMLEITT